MPGQKDSDSGKENVVNAGKYFKLSWAYSTMIFLKIH